MTRIIDVQGRLLSDHDQRRMAQFPHAQWVCDNAEELEELLIEFEVRADSVSGDRLRIRGLGGLEIFLMPGDAVIVDTGEDARIGILRALPAEGEKVN